MLLRNGMTNSEVRDRSESWDRVWYIVHSWDGVLHGIGILRIVGNVGVCKVYVVAST